MTDIERRDNHNGGRRDSDGYGDGDEYVRRAELSGIIREAVKQVLDEYEHECVLNLRDSDNEYVRDMVNAVREVGDGDLPKGITIMRENHKFVHSCQKAATKIGWGVIIAVATIMGTLGMVAISAWNVKAGGNL